jgi:hypothetical protein
VKFYTGRARRRERAEHVKVVLMTDFDGRGVGSNQSSSPMGLVLSASVPLGGFKQRPSQKLSAGKFHFEPPFTSFDHLVGERKQCRWHGEAERLAMVYNLKQTAVISNFSHQHTSTRFPSRDYIAGHLESPNRSMRRIASSREGS